MGTCFLIEPLVRDLSRTLFTKFYKDFLCAMPRAGSSVMMSPWLWVGLSFILDELQFWSFFVWFKSLYLRTQQFQSNS